VALAQTRTENPMTAFSLVAAEFWHNTRSRIDYNDPLECSRRRGIGSHSGPRQLGRLLATGVDIPGRLPRAVYP